MGGLAGGSGCQLQVNDDSEKGDQRFWGWRARGAERSEAEKRSRAERRSGQSMRCAFCYSRHINVGATMIPVFSSRRYFFPSQCGQDWEGCLPRRWYFGTLEFSCPVMSCFLILGRT